MKRILVIDDDPAVCSAFVEALATRDYEADGVGSGPEGIDSARRREPDLIFLDLQMPGMTGVETLSRLRRICPTVPICIVTGFQGELLDAISALCRAGDAVEVARKPLTVAEIRAIAEGVFAGTPRPLSARPPKLH